MAGLILRLREWGLSALRWLPGEGAAKLGVPKLGGGGTFRAAAYAPYPLRIYRDLLARVRRSHDLRLAPFCESAMPEEGQSDLFIRHDIDTANCMCKLPMLLEMDRLFNLRAGVFFRVDDQEYRLMEHQDLVVQALQSGCEVGLHTVCYTEDRYLEALQREIEKFSREAGYAPKTFSVHGLGEYRWDIRMRFYEEIAKRMGEFGLQFGDIPHLRPYDHVIQDCHWDGERKRRYLSDDFIRPRRFLRRGRLFLVLTHPCYWQA